MSKLSPALKALIAKGADPLPGPSASRLHALFSKYDASVSSPKSWVTMASASLFTLNSPSSLSHLWAYLDQKHGDDLQARVRQAALLREVGLKSISFIGIAKIINQLAVLHSVFPEEVKQRLNHQASRDVVEPEDYEDIVSRGEALWADIYKPFDDKLAKKLAAYHPDLPVQIIDYNYGPLLSDPDPEDGATYPVDRVLTSVVAVACLRAQQGVGPQVTSHIFGLRKAEHAGWLGSDEGCHWLLTSIDEICQEVQQPQRESQL